MPTKSTSASVPSKAVNNEARVETIDAPKDSPTELTETSFNVLDDVLTSRKETSQQATTSSVADEERPNKDDLASLCRINQECYSIDIFRLIDLANEKLPRQDKGNFWQNLLNV